MIPSFKFFAGLSFCCLFVCCHFKPSQSTQWRQFWNPRGCMGESDEKIKEVICVAYISYSAAFLNCFGVACVGNGKPLMRLSILFGIKYFETVCTLWYQGLPNVTPRMRDCRNYVISASVCRNCVIWRIFGSQNYGFSAVAILPQSRNYGKK